MRSRLPWPATALLVPVLNICLATGAWAQGATQFTLTAKVRDFKESNPTSPDGTHPNFNVPIGCSAQEMGVNTVQEILDVSGPADGGDFPGDNRGPKLLDPLPAVIASCYNPIDRFGDWFSDRDAAVNRSYLVGLAFKRDDASGLYVFKDNAFFPIDAGKPVTKIHVTDPDPFGNLQTGTLDGKDLSAHNYGFTMELHTEFGYEQGKAQLLRYQGDDDIWVFLNGKRVVDMGGVHQTQYDSVDLDAHRVDLGIEDGKSYPLDFFFAERHVASSTVMITTNMVLASPIRRAQPDLRAAASGPVSIYDRSGRLIRELPGDIAWTTARSGATAPAWDRLDAAGHRATTGVYLWRTIASAFPRAGMVSIP